MQKQKLKGLEKDADKPGIIFFYDHKPRIYLKVYLFKVICYKTTSVSYSGVNAVFTPSSNLTPNLEYTARIKGNVGGVTDLAIPANAMLMELDHRCSRRHHRTHGNSHSIC